MIANHLDDSILAEVCSSKIMGDAQALGIAHELGAAHFYQDAVVRVVGVHLEEVRVLVAVPVMNASIRSECLDS